MKNKGRVCLEIGTLSLLSEGIISRCILLVLFIEFNHLNKYFRITIIYFKWYKVSIIISIRFFTGEGSPGLKERK
jgi:hypothetical protein